MLSFFLTSFYLPTSIASLLDQSSLYSCDVPSISLIESSIFLLSKFISIIFAFTFCPTLSSSSGFDIFFSHICEICTKPSTPFSNSANAPNGTNLEIFTFTTSPI